MSICLVGKSCSGKDTIAKELENMGYKRIVTYTTRPIRHNEIDGVDYHFVTNGQFLHMVENGEFAEWRDYKTTDGIWYYGSRFADYVGKHKVIILTPDGFKNLNEKGISDLVSFYINVNKSELKRRSRLRLDDKKESKRRRKADKKDFRGVEKIVDYIIDNTNSDPFTVASICNEMNGIGKRKNV